MFQNLFVSFDHSFRYTSTVSDDDSAPISHVTIGKKSYSEGVISFVLHFQKHHYLGGFLLHNGPMVFKS